MNEQLGQAHSLLSSIKPNPDKAIQLLKSLLQQRNTMPDVYMLLGKALLMKKQPKMAERILKEAIHKKMASQTIYLHYSEALLQLGHIKEADNSAREAVKLDTTNVSAWVHLGRVMTAQSKPDEALRFFQRANQIDPSNPEVAFFVGSVYADQGLTDKAMQLLDIALKIKPDYLDAILKKAAVLTAAGKDEELETLYEHYMAVLPEQEATFRLGLAEMYRTSGKYEKSLQQFEHLLATHSRLSIVLGGYANLLLDLGRFHEAEDFILRAHKADPENIRIYNAYLMAMHYNPDRTRKTIFKAYQQYARLYSPEKRPERPAPENKEPDKKLRIGLLSSGLRKHPVGWMIARSLEQLPKDQFEFYAYSLHNITDEITSRIHQRCAGWRNVKGKPEHIIEKQIRQDHIDILVDLNGVSADSRVRVILNEPAPVLVKWVGGLLNTSGLPAVDYLISDAYETPKGDEKWYTEKLVRLPDDYICFLPPDYAPDVAPLPALKQGFITFGCFNNPIKINQKLLEKWAQILHRVPESRLLLKSKQFGTAVFSDPVASFLEDRGIDRSRILFDGYAPHSELLKTYNRVDIALDPWPYSGGLSTCEALWMGVPVITYPGPTFAGKHSNTHLINAGYAGFVAKDWDDYVDKAVALAKNPKNLEHMRADMRDRVEQSPLCDGERFAAHLGKAFREMWVQRVAGWESGAGEWRDHIVVEAAPVESGDEMYNASIKLMESEGRVNGNSDFLEQMDSESEQLQRNSSKFDAIYSAEKDQLQSSSSVSVALDSAQTPLSDEGQDLIKKTAKPLDNDKFLDSPPSDQEEFAADIEDAWFVPLNHRTRLCVPPTVADPISYALLERQRWYEPEIDFLNRYLKSGMNVLEMNASYGMFTIPMALKVGSEGKVNVWVEKKKDRAFVLKSGERNELNNINALESYPSQTDDLGQVDVLMVAKLAQFNDHHSTQPKVVLINKPADDKSVKALFKSLSETGFKPFVYVASVGILTEVSEMDVVEPHITRIVAINNHEMDDLKRQGFIFNGGEELIEPEPSYWRGQISEMPWSEPVWDEWESLPKGEAVTIYQQALNWALIGTDKSKSGSYRASALLKAADLLIDLFNAGFVYRPVSLTMIRVLNDLGKREQALAVLKRVMQTKADAEENTLALPFLPVLAIQEEIPVRDNFSNWLTVRTIEAWLLLNNHSMHSASQENLKFLAALHNNHESSALLERMYAVASMRTNNGFFSQFGEDKVLDEILSPSRKKGFYVDIGAFDPMKYSNTLRLHLFGWAGVNVDANNDSIQTFGKSRPMDKNVYAAVTETTGTVKFFKADKLGEVNTLSSKHREKWQKRGVSYDAVHVPSRRLEDILDEVVPEGQQIDFMSIDVEEAEMGVLKSNNWKKYRPNVIAIEVHEFNPERPEQSEVAKTLINHGYDVVKNCVPTVIFQSQNNNKAMSRR